MNKNKALHRRIHTFGKAYAVAVAAIRELALDPHNQLDLAQAVHYKALATVWAQTPAEITKANALTHPPA